MMGAGTQAEVVGKLNGWTSNTLKGRANHLTWGAKVKYKACQDSSAFTYFIIESPEGP